MDRTNEPLMAAFAEVLHRRRRAAGLTQEQLAEKADVSVRFISFLETSRRQPTLTMIAAISHGLSVTMAELTADVEATLAMAKDVQEQE